MTSARKAVRGLRSPGGKLGMEKMNRKAAEIYLEAAVKEAPKHSGALADSGKITKGRGFQSNVNFGNRRVDYVPTVVGGGGRAQQKPNKFGKRAMQKTEAARKKVYEDGIRAAVIALGLRRR